MRTFSLLFQEDGSGEARRIDFEALDPSAALDVARREGHERSIELWEGSMMLGTIQHYGDFWKLSRAGP